FFLCRFAIRAGVSARIAERGAGDEDVFASEADRAEKTIEVRARLIAGKRHARSIGAFASGRFADEHDACVRRAVQVAQHRAAATHRRTARALRSFINELLKSLLCRSLHSTTVSSRVTIPPFFTGQ